METEYKEITKGLITVVLKVNDTKNYLSENLKVGVYEYDPEGNNKRYPTDQACLGKLLDSKLVLSEFDEKLSQGYYKFTFDVTDAVNSSLDSQVFTSLCLKQLLKSAVKSRNQVLPSPYRNFSLPVVKAKSYC